MDSPSFLARSCQVSRAVISKLSEEMHHMRQRHSVSWERTTRIEERRASLFSFQSNLGSVTRLHPPRDTTTGRMSDSLRAPPREAATAPDPVGGCARDAYSRRTAQT
ncbi:hypothetical protein HPB50_013111 [Hyalomma asiaticum]|uniref:Uncharacterized protein n=1 Tax=Hyalomma asiaticum TaxID=266040 RepID=A0ACB7SC95_HYAAI|nr:hypothetical protein HPB50_013111 [Hyalomma asiaticum]